VLFPAPCRICQRPLVNASRIPVCEPCLESFERLEPPICQQCGRPSRFVAAGLTGPALCRLCRTGTYGFARARSFAIYNDALGAAVVLLKYEEVKRLGEWFAARLGETMAQQGGEFRPDMVAPVPLHRDRLRERGYNQAEVIARPLARRLGLPLLPRLLVRARPRPPQLVLSRRERWNSVRGAYVTHADARVDKARILLVDDVFTTGATLDACARALRKAGAAEVMGLTVARVVPKWLLGSPQAREIEKNRQSRSRI